MHIILEGENMYIPGIGTIVNILTVVLGSLLGIFFKMHAANINGFNLQSFFY